MLRMLFLLTLGAISGCGSESNGPLHPAADAISGSSDGVQSLGESAAVGRMLIQRAEVSLVVVDFASAEQDLRNVLESVGGLVAEAREEQRPARPRSGRWVLRVRAAQFSAALEAICALGIPERREISTDDVTAAWVDHEARLASWKRMEGRLLALVDTHTGALKDLLTVEGELNRVRGEIEKLQARQRALADQVTLATIVVALREDRDFLPPAPPTFVAQVEATFQQSCQLLRRTGEAIALVATALAPWLAAAAVLLAAPGIWWLRSRRRRPAAAT